MKSVLSNKCCEKKELPYPKLMIGTASGKVYLMNCRSAGTLVHVPVNKSGQVGRNFGLLDDNYMEDYEGDVCLTNDPAT